MKRVPVYEVIEQQPVEEDPKVRLKPQSRSVFRPVVGDECNVTIMNVRQSGADDGCSSSVLFGDHGLATASPGVVFDVAVVLGEVDCAVDRALGAVLSDMTTGETREFCVGDGRSGRVSGRLRLAAVRKRAMASVGWRADDRLKLIEAARHKEAGNRLYGQRRYVDAFHRFNRVIRAVLFLRDPDAARPERDALYAAACNNMAACQLHFGNYEHARRLSEKTLTVDPDNLKALVRRCRAYTELGLFVEALADADKALIRDPGNAVAERYRQVAFSGVQRQDAVHRDMAKKMFAAQ